MHTPVTILFNNFILEFLTALSSLDITALPKSIIPRTIMAIGINIFKIKDNKSKSINHNQINNVNNNINQINSAFNF